MGAVDLDVAVGADEQQAGAVEVAGQMDEQIERAAVGVVQVLEDDDQRLHGGGVAQEAGDGLQQPLALLLGVARSSRSRRERVRAACDRQAVADLARRCARPRRRRSRDPAFRPSGSRAST